MNLPDLAETVREVRQFARPAALQQARGDFAHDAEFSRGMTRVKNELFADVMAPVVRVAKASFAASAAPSAPPAATARTGNAEPFAPLSLPRVLANLVGAYLGAWGRVLVVATVGLVAGLPYALGRATARLCGLLPRPASPHAARLVDAINARLANVGEPHPADARIDRAFATDLTRGRMMVERAGLPEGAYNTLVNVLDPIPGASAPVARDGSDASVRAAASRVEAFCRGDAPLTRAVSAMLSQTLHNVAYEVAHEAKAIRFAGGHQLVVGGQKPFESRAWSLTPDPAGRRYVAVHGLVSQSGGLNLFAQPENSGGRATPQPLEVSGRLDRHVEVHLVRTDEVACGVRCIGATLSLVGELGERRFAWQVA